MALAPELGEAWLARGTYRWRVLNDPAAALQAYREAEKRLPNSALVNEYMAYAERRLSRWREAEAHLTSAIELDPRNARLWTRPCERHTLAVRTSGRGTRSTTIGPWKSHPTMSSLSRSRLSNTNKKGD